MSQMDISTTNAEPARAEEIVQTETNTRPQRQRQLPTRLRDYEVFSDTSISSEGDIVHMAFLAEMEPISFEQPITEECWIEAMKDEIHSIEKNNTWQLTTLLEGKKPISVKWVFKVKLKPDGSVAKHKARLVARGFLQRPGIDFDEVFAPVARIETIRLVIAIAASKDWTLSQMNVKSAFLNGPLDREVFVSQPLGFEVAGQEQKVYKLNKALYGLKQTPRAWNKRINNFLIKQGLIGCSNEHEIYVKSSHTTASVIICLYVDDLLITGCIEEEIDQLKGKLKMEFEMSDLGSLSYFLGMEFVRSSRGILMHQKKYTSDVIKRFEMSDCNASPTPVEVGNALCRGKSEDKAVDTTHYRQLIGSLRYICNTRPDIAYGVGLVSRYMEDPRQNHLVAAKRVLRYLRGSLDFGLWFPACQGGNPRILHGNTDADWGGDKDDRKSTTGYLFKLSNASISWSSQKQKVVALSSCEAEYIAACLGGCQGLWLKSLIIELGVYCSESMVLFVDNKSAISLAKNPILHGRSKHIETRFHYLRDQVEKGNLRLEFCASAEQQADLLTKPLKKENFERQRKQLGIISLATLN
ncbi:unnamed protein product [Lupinus luteus]|uniref:Reverse transcriptase Ty1/copia-type domain-containing protein n=1 Tax=Lupinus luteus TaxID=3873 RepID=A0AAV1WXD4_LUPLU